MKRPRIGRKQARPETLGFALQEGLGPKAESGRQSADFGWFWIVSRSTPR